MQGEEIRRRLHAGSLVYGTHITQTTNAVAAMHLAKADLDFVFVCGEHMPMDPTDASAACWLFANRGISPIVRISHPSAVEAAKALDTGAQGIVAPYVESVEQVRQVVGAVHYRPVKGRKLAEYLSGQKQPSAKMVEFFNRFNRHSYVIIGVESVAGWENLDDLLSVPGVDGVFIGPHDLSVSLDAPEQWDNPALLSMMKRIVVRCRAANVGVGVHLPTGVFSLKYVQELIAAGMNWILDGADIVHSVLQLNQRRAAMGIEHHPEPAGATADVEGCTVVDSSAAVTQVSAH